MPTDTETDKPSSNLNDYLKTWDGLEKAHFPARAQSLLLGFGPRPWLFGTYASASAAMGWANCHWYHQAFLAGVFLVVYFSTQSENAKTKQRGKGPAQPGRDSSGKTTVGGSPSADGSVLAH